MKRTVAILIVVAAVLATFAAVSLDRSEAAASPEAGQSAVERSAPAAYGTDNQTGIWVSGQGTLSVSPDLAVIDLGVESVAESVSEANEAGGDIDGRHHSRAEEAWNQGSGYTDAPLRHISRSMTMWRKRRTAGSPASACSRATA